MIPAPRYSIRAPARLSMMTCSFQISASFAAGML
jgi:hypothetical protein